MTTLDKLLDAVQILVDAIRLEAQEENKQVVPLASRELRYEVTHHAAKKKSKLGCKDCGSRGRHYKTCTAKSKKRIGNEEFYKHVCDNCDKEFTSAAAPGEAKCPKCNELV